MQNSNKHDPQGRDNQPHRQSVTPYFIEQHYFTYLHVINIKSIQPIITHAQ